MGDGADDAFENALRECERDDRWDEMFARDDGFDYWPSAVGLPLYAFDLDVALHELLERYDRSDWQPEDPCPGDST